MINTCQKDYLCNFTLDNRFIELCDRLQKYYDDTPDSISNKDAIYHWMEFTRWCTHRGFTQNEINKAKYSRKYG